MTAKILAGIFFIIPHVLVSLEVYILMREKQPKHNYITDGEKLGCWVRAGVRGKGQLILVKRKAFLRRCSHGRDENECSVPETKEPADSCSSSEGISVARGDCEEGVVVFCHLSAVGGEDPSEHCGSQPGL